jgi:hypothetical protein
MIFSGLTRTDGSIVEGPYAPAGANNQSFIQRPTPNLQGADLVEQIQMRMQQRDVKTPAFMKYAKDVLDTQGYPTQSLQYYQNQFGGSPLGAMIPEQGPLGPGLVGGTQPSPSPQLPNGTGTQMPIGGFSISNIPSVNSNNTQGIGAFFNNENQQNNFSYINNNNNQDFGQYLNSYINNSINQRMQSIFKGIMSLFQ